MQIDIQSLTLGEIDRIETLAGQSIDSFGEDDTPKGKMMAALVFVYKRREQLAAGVPLTFKWEDALAMPMTEATAFLGFSDDEDEDEDLAVEVEHTDDEPVWDDTPQQPAPDFAEPTPVAVERPTDPED